MDAGVRPAGRCPMCKAIRWTVRVMPVLVIVANGAKWFAIS